MMALSTDSTACFKSIRGHIQNGIIVTDEPLNLPEGAEIIVAYCLPGKSASPSLYDHYQNIIGACESLPDDAAEQIDHYVYGTIKR